MYVNGASMLEMMAAWERWSRRFWWISWGGSSAAESMVKKNSGPSFGGGKGLRLRL